MAHCHRLESGLSQKTHNKEQTFPRLGGQSSAMGLKIRDLRMTHLLYIGFEPVQSMVFDPFS